MLDLFWCYTRFTCLGCLPPAAFVLDAVRIRVCVWVEAYEDMRHSSGVLEMFHHLSALAYTLIRLTPVLMLIHLDS